MSHFPHKVGFFLNNFFLSFLLSVFFLPIFTVNEIHNSFTSMKFTNLFASVKSSAFSDVMKIDSGELKFCDNFTKNAVFPVILKTDELTEGKGGGGTGSKIERKSLSFVFERRVGEVFFFFLKDGKKNGMGKKMPRKNRLFQRLPLSHFFFDQ